MKKILVLVILLMTTMSLRVHAQASLNFEGVDDYIQIPNPVANTTAFTIEFWMKTTQTGASGAQWYNGTGLVDGEMPGAQYDFGTSLDGSKIAFGIGDPDKPVIENTSSPKWNFNNMSTWKGGVIDNGEWCGANI